MGSPMLAALPEQPSTASLPAQAARSAWIPPTCACLPTLLPLCRLLPEHFLGLRQGEAEVIRNGGGRVTEDVIRWAGRNRWGGAGREGGKGGRGAVSGSGPSSSIAPMSLGICGLCIGRDPPAC